MNKGIVSIYFTSGLCERYEIISDEELIHHPNWMSIEMWWMSAEEDSIVFLNVGDDLLLLDRAKVTHVCLKKHSALEINSGG